MENSPKAIEQSPEDEQLEGVPDFAAANEVSNDELKDAFGGVGMEVTDREAGQPAIPEALAGESKFGMPTGLDQESEAKADAFFAENAEKLKNLEENGPSAPETAPLAEKETAAPASGEQAV